MLHRAEKQGESARLPGTEAREADAEVIGTNFVTGPMVVFGAATPVTTFASAGAKPQVRILTIHLQIRSTAEIGRE